MPISYRNSYRKQIDFTLKKKRYSEPKLFIPRVNGRASMGKNAVWYVYFYWRTDPNGPLNKMFTKNGGINRLKTAKERRAAGKSLIDAYKHALERGWNPETKEIVTKSRVDKKEMSLADALNFAFDVRAKTNKQSTTDSYRFYLDRFLDWCKENGYYGMPVDKFTIDDFYLFYDWLRFDYKHPQTGKEMSGSSINNHRRSLSALFTVMKNERFIPQNFLNDIPNIEAVPKYNKAFTLEEIKRIRKRLEKDDPYLIAYISFIIYGLLRPREIARLKVKDLRDQDFFGVETKTEAISYRRIIEKLRPAIKLLNLEGAPEYCSAFSPEDKPMEWNVNLKSKVDYFGKRFKPIKESMGFGREYSIYSFRHSAIVNLYNGMVDEGMGEQEIIHKLMPITRHKSISGVKNYLRKHKQSIPPDHSDLYSLDF